MLYCMVPEGPSKELYVFIVTCNCELLSAEMNACLCGFMPLHLLVFGIALTPVLKRYFEVSNHLLRASSSLNGNSSHAETKSTAKLWARVWRAGRWGEGMWSKRQGGESGWVSEEKE